MPTETPTFADRLAKLTSQLVEMTFEIENAGDDPSITTYDGGDVSLAYEWINTAIHALHQAGKELNPEFESKIGPTEE